MNCSAVSRAMECSSALRDDRGPSAREGLDGVLSNTPLCARLCEPRSDVIALGPLERGGSTPGSI